MPAIAFGGNGLIADPAALTRLPLTCCGGALIVAEYEGAHVQSGHAEVAALRLPVEFEAAFSMIRLH